MGNVVYYTGIYNFATGPIQKGPIPPLFWTHSQRILLSCSWVGRPPQTGGDTGAWAQEGVAEAGSAQCGVATVRCLLDADTLAPKERPRRRQYRSHFRRLTANVSPSARQTPASSQPAATKPSAVASPGTVFLSTRMLAVEEFRQERLIRSRLEHPPPPPSEAIPVPLYPETVEQYNHKFEQWLADRHESLESLHCNAKRERKLRLLMWNRTGLADARFHKKGTPAECPRVQLATDQRPQQPIVPASHPDQEVELRYWHHAAESSQLRTRSASPPKDEENAREAHECPKPREDHFASSTERGHTDTAIVPYSIPEVNSNENETIALADLMCNGWKVREEALLLLIVEKDNALETHEKHLKEQLQWATETPPDVVEAYKVFRFDALRKLSKRLAKQQKSSSRLSVKKS
ncbi:hypothetical protein ON010_g809 [Phytophthora cinnamomi]|nr:hypothetical protein ON010_g809 [Phytophthora cinnamomi]